MTLFFGPFIASLLLLGVSGTAAETCSDIFGAMDCALSYSDKVSNMTMSQVLNATLVCGMLAEFKSCLTTTCGSWDAIPENIATVFQQQEQAQSCDAPQKTCADFVKAMACYSVIEDAMNNTVTFFADTSVACKMMAQYKTCLSDACGAWDRVPQEASSILDKTLSQNNLNCNSNENGAGFAQCSSALLITLVLSLAALIFSLG